MADRLLVAMSIGEVNSLARLAELAQQVGAQVACLQVGEPAVTTALNNLADLGSERVEVVGVVCSRLAPGQSWLRRVVGHWVRERSDTKPEVVVSRRLVGPVRLTSDLIETAFCDTRPVTGSEAPLTSPAWQDVPNYKHHVLVCRGPRCAARGADETWVSLRELLRQHELGDEVLTTTAGCMFPCNNAPVVSVQPDDVWYRELTAKRLPDFVEQHLLGGTPLSQLRIR